MGRGVAGGEGNGPQVSLSGRDVTGLLIGEQILHGYAIARASGRPWLISEADALLISHGWGGTGRRSGRRLPPHSSTRED